MSNAVRLMFVFFLAPVAGCFGAQRDAINAKAAQQSSALDAECKDNMTDWCALQYQRIELVRESGLSDVSKRQSQTVESLAHMGDGFKH